MQTQCNAETIYAGRVGSREVGVDFDGGRISSDAGVAPSWECRSDAQAHRTGATCFQDGRDPELIEHSVQTSVMQRIVGIALGYQDLNDHDQLRSDPVIYLSCGCKLKWKKFSIDIVLMFF